MLKFLREFPGAKTERKRFLLSQGKLCFAKIAVLGAAKPPLRIDVGGAAPLQTTLGFMKFYIFRNWQKERRKMGRVPLLLIHGIVQIYYIPQT